MTTVTEFEQLDLFSDEDRVHKEYSWQHVSIFSRIGAGHLAKQDRETDDYYATDPSAVRWLMELETLDKNIWECACGEGHLGKVLEECGYNVKATDLIDRGYGVGG